MSISAFRLPSRVSAQVPSVLWKKSSSRRIAAAFDTTEERLYDEYFRRLGNLQPLVEVPSDEAPVHVIKITGRDVDLTRLPFHPQHARDGSCYISSAIDYTVDPQSGRRNVGCRRLSLRNRYECGTNVTAPSDLKRIYTACAARRERLPVTFTVGGDVVESTRLVLVGDRYEYRVELRRPTAGATP